MSSVYTFVSDITYETLLQQGLFETNKQKLLI